MNKKTLKLVTSLVAIAMGVLAVVMIFLDAIKMEAFGMSEGYSGLNVVFGKKEEGEEMFKFGVMPLLTYVLALAGAVVAAVKLLTKKNELILNIVTAVLFVAATVLFFLMTNLVSLPEGIKESYDMMKELGFVKLGVGSILAAVFSILGAVAAGAEIAVDKLVKDQE